MQGLLPSGWREGVKEVVVVRLVGDDEFFRTGVGAVEFLAELGGDDGVIRGENDGDRTAIAFQPIL